VLTDAKLMTSNDLVALDLPGAVADLAAPAYVIDRDGRFSWVNRALVDIFGDLRGTLFLERVAPEHRQLARTNFTRKVVGQVSTQIFDMVVIDREGGRVPMRFSSAPLRRDDRVVGVFGVAIPLARTSSAQSPLDDLTPRQLEVLRLLAEGLETPQIARRLGVADETARNHIRALLRATGAHSRLEVVLMGFRSGLLRTELTQPDHEVEAATADEGS
jgi:PAS domain S-box-containing protein